MRTTTKQRGGVTGKGFQPGESGKPNGRPKVKKIVRARFGAGPGAAAWAVVGDLNDFLGPGQGTTSGITDLVTRSRIRRVVGPRARWRRAALAALRMLAVVAVSGCAMAPREPGEERGDELVGVASWYGARHHGRSTASGQPFDMHRLSAAHRTLPLGTRVRVTNLENRRSVVVRIVDRGPYVRDRVIDLSYAAAKALDLIERGMARVRLEVLPPAP